VPLVGFIDPSHDERAADEPGRLPRWIPLNELLDASIAEGPKWSPWPYELIRAVLEQHQERDYLSTSMLTGGCMRGNVIERREDYVDRLDSRYAALRGTWIHALLETMARDGALAEWRFFTTYRDVEFSCSPDIIIPDQGILSDYKTTENPPSFGYAYRHHTEQVQVNRWVVNNATKWEGPNGEKDIPVDPRAIQFYGLTVVYLGPKEPKTILAQKTAEKRTPNGNVVKGKVNDVWTDKAVEKWLMPRLDAVMMALDSYPEWPEGLEKMPGWEGPPTWACPGPPLCYLPGCMAKRWPNGLVW
jgi:hypothetical protein